MDSCDLYVCLALLGVLTCLQVNFHHFTYCPHESVTLCFLTHHCWMNVVLLKQNKFTAQILNIPVFSGIAFRDEILL